MFVVAILIFANCLCDLTLAAIVKTQQLRYGRRFLQNPKSSNTKTPVAEMNIAFDLPDLIAPFELESGSVQLEGFKSVNNDKIDMTGPKKSELFWVTTGHPHFFKTEDPKNPGHSRFFYSTNAGFTAYIQMMTEEQRAALAKEASSKYQINIANHQVVHLILSKFYCNLSMYDEAGSKNMIHGTVSDFNQFPLKMDFDILPGKIERLLFSKRIEESEIDLQFECHLESSGGKLKKINTLSINYEESQRIGLEEKLFGTAGNDGPGEVYVSRNQMFQLAHEMHSTLNIIEEYQMPESKFSESFVNDFISQLASSQFGQISIDKVLKSISKYSFDISADLQPNTIKKDFGSFLTIKKTGEKSQIVFHEKKFSDVSKTYGGSFGADATVPSVIEVGAQAAFNISKRDITSTGSLNDQMRELNTLSQNESQWEIEGEKIVPKSLNVARLMRSNMKKSLTFNRIKIQQVNAPFESNFKIYTSRETPLQCQPVSAPKAKVCPYGFDYFPEIDQCLYLNLELMTWDNARMACTRMKTGAQLVMIMDPAKQEAVSSYLGHQFTKQEPKSAACKHLRWTDAGKISWLGGQTQDPNKCGTPYYWKPVGAEEIPFNYTNWFPGWPYCANVQQNCALIASSPYYSYRWEDEPCERLFCSVCEF